MLVWTLALTPVVLNEEGYASTASVWAMCDMLRRRENTDGEQRLREQAVFCNLKLHVVEIRVFEFGRGF